MSTTEQLRYPAETDEAFPEVFTKPPPQPSEAKPGQLTSEQVNQFFDQGFLVVENYFKREELEACKTAVCEVVDDFAKWLHKNGKLKELYEDQPFEKRLILIEKEFPGSTMLIMIQGRLKQAMRDLWTNDRLLNLVEQLIGPDIAGHPVWNLRTKAPNNEATVVPWHQDIAYLDNDAYKVLQPAAWIPLVDATEQNGCMQFIKGSHRTGRICRHTAAWASTHYVMMDETDIESRLDVNMENDVVTCPVPFGGMVLLNNLVAHRSLPNMSDGIRWSMDLRWQTPHKPCGFHGIKDMILFRTLKDPNHVIDWTPYEAPPLPENPTDADYEVTIPGPWLRRWEITHQNKHTEKLASNKNLMWHKSAK